MNTDYTHLLPDNFDDRSRVWIYQSNRLFSVHEALEIEDMLRVFTGQWDSHGIPVKAHGNLLFGHFIVLIADETGHGVSGCSTDASVRFIKEIEKKFNVSLFDRMLLAFIVKERIQLMPMQQLSYAFENNFISPENIYFNNTITSFAQLKNNWLIPVNKSWLSSDRRYQQFLAGGLETTNN